MFGWKKAVDPRNAVIKEFENRKHDSPMEGFLKTIFENWKKSNPNATPFADIQVNDVDLLANDRNKQLIYDRIQILNEQSRLPEADRMPMPELYKIRGELFKLMRGQKQIPFNPNSANQRAKPAPSRKANAGSRTAGTGLLPNAGRELLEGVVEDLRAHVPPAPQPKVNVGEMFSSGLPNTIAQLNRIIELTPYDPSSRSKYNVDRNLCETGCIAACKDLASGIRHLAHDALLNPDLSILAQCRAELDQYRAKLLNINDQIARTPRGRLQGFFQGKTTLELHADSTRTAIAAKEVILQSLELSITLQKRPDYPAALDVIKDLSIRCIDILENKTEVTPELIKYIRKQIIQLIKINANGIEGNESITNGIDEDIGSFILVLIISKSRIEPVGRARNSNNEDVFTIDQIPTVLTRERFTDIRDGRGLTGRYGFNPLNPFNKGSIALDENRLPLAVDQATENAKHVLNRMTRTFQQVIPSAVIQIGQAASAATAVQGKALCASFATRLIGWATTAKIHNLQVAEEQLNVEILEEANREMQHTSNALAATLEVALVSQNPDAVQCTLPNEVTTRNASTGTVPLNSNNLSRVENMQPNGPNSLDGYNSALNNVNNRKMNNNGPKEVLPGANAVNENRQMNNNRANKGNKQMNNNRASEVNEMAQEETPVKYPDTDVEEDENAGSGQNEGIGATAVEEDRGSNNEENANEEIGETAVEDEPGAAAEMGPNAGNALPRRGPSRFYRNNPNVPNANSDQETNNYEQNDPGMKRYPLGQPGNNNTRHTTKSPTFGGAFTSEPFKIQSLIDDIDKYIEDLPQYTIELKNIQNIVKKYLPLDDVPLKYDPCFAKSVGEILIDVENMNVPMQQKVQVKKGKPVTRKVQFKGKSVTRVQVKKVSKTKKNKKVQSKNASKTKNTPKRNKKTTRRR